MKMLWSARVVLFSTVLISHAGAVIPHNIPSVNQNKQPRLNLMKKCFNTGFKYLEIGFYLFCQHNI
jgi:hypothetical protein